jgi:hypothetical protein
MGTSTFGLMTHCLNLRRRPSKRPDGLAGSSVSKVPMSRVGSVDRPGCAGTQVIIGMPDQSANCVTTSPLCWTKRDYGMVGPVRARGPP